GRALAIAGIGAIVLIVVPEPWTWSFAVQPRAEMAAAPQDTPVLAVSLDGGRPRVRDAFTFRRRTAGRKEIATHAIVTGVPPEFHVRTIAARSRLELPGGQVLQTGGANSNAARTEIRGGSMAARGVSIEATLGGVRLLTRGDVT